MEVKYFKYKKMNKLILILLSAIITVGLASCYDDKGNYSYKDLNSVEITGIDEEYLVEQFDTIAIYPNLTMSIDSNESNFDYAWYLYSNPNKPASDTISTERNLNIPLGVMAGTYTAIYQVTDKKTGVYYKYSFTIKVVTSFSNGLVVLSEVDGKGNITFLNSTNKLYQDVYYTANGEYLGEKPVALGNMFNRSYQAVLIMLGDGSGGVVADPLSFSKMQNYSDLFWVSPNDSYRPMAMFRRSTSEEWVIENGQYHHRNFMYPGEAKFGAPLVLGTDLFATMFQAGMSDRVFYDNAGEKFIVHQTNYSGDVVSMPDSLFNPADLKMQMICGGDGFKDRGYGLFYDDDANEYYSLSFSCNGSSIRPLTQSHITSATDIESAASIAVSKLSPQYFYAVDNKLYCLDALADVTKLIYTFDAGMTIDYIELKNDDTGLSDDNSKVMYVGTSTEGTGKVGSFHIMDVALNGTVKIRESYNNVAGKILDFLYKEVY